jgi:hypothetical protein
VFWLHRRGGISRLTARLLAFHKGKDIFLLRGLWSILRTRWPTHYCCWELEEFHYVTYLSPSLSPLHCKAVVSKTSHLILEIPDRLSSRNSFLKYPPLSSWLLIPDYSAGVSWILVFSRIWVPPTSFFFFFFPYWLRPSLFRNVTNVTLMFFTLCIRSVSLGLTETSIGDYARQR